MTLFYAICGWIQSTKGNFYATQENHNDFTLYPKGPGLWLIGRVEAGSRLVTERSSFRQGPCINRQRQLFCGEN